MPTEIIFKNPPPALSSFRRATGGFLKRDGTWAMRCVPARLRWDRLLAVQFVSLRQLRGSGSKDFTELMTAGRGGGGGRRNRANRC